MNYMELKELDDLRSKAWKYHLKKVLEDLENLSITDIFIINDWELIHKLLEVQVKLTELKTELELQKQDLQNNQK